MQLNIRSFAAFCCIMLCALVMPAQDLKSIWDKINNNERNEALTILEPKIKSGTATMDEYVTYHLLMVYDGKESEITNYEKFAAQSGNPDAYTYALWFSVPVAGQYGQKLPHQASLLSHVVAAQPGNGTLRASAHYNLGQYYIVQHKFSEAKKENSMIGAVTNWQFVGPFSNTSGSGFNKNYEPVKDPSNASVFSSSNNAPIKWFTPLEQATEGWIYPQYFISRNTSSIVYAQTFVNSPAAQDVILCTGFAGNMKVWVNDQLLINEPEEMVTEMDTYNAKCHLNAGYNRVLVQLGGSENEPNFIVRLTNENYDPVTNLTSVAAPQEYTKTEGENVSHLPLFAETYFQKKIEEEPGNLVNYVLLNQAYLRNKKVFDARKTVEKALKMAPNNMLLKYELLQCFLKENNRTGLSEMVEYFKEKDKNSIMGYVLRIQELKNEEKNQEALDLLEERLKTYGWDVSGYDDKIQLLGTLEKVPELIALINEAYAKYPDNSRFVNYVFNVEKSVNKNPKKALKVLEGFMKKHYNYELAKLLIREYYEQNNSKKAYALLNEQVSMWPYDPVLRVNILSEYIDEQRYSEAYDLCNVILKLRPYSGTYYQNKASVEVSLGRNDDAIESYKKAILYQPTLYEAREKLRILQNKPALRDAAPHSNIDELVQKTGKNIDAENHDYYFLINDDVNIIYPEGAREETYTVAIKVLNQRGIDTYKETRLSYNDNTETLVIEDAQLIKPNGRKIRPEINYNDIVWTGLEANDVIYVKYKKKFYYVGKLASEYYDHFAFGDFTPMEVSRYSLIIPASKKFDYKMLNGELEPKISEYEDYKVYVWEKENIPALKDEPYMPAAVDVLPTLHISTLPDWNEVAQWYSDMVYSKITNDYEVSETYQQLFGDKKDYTSDEKARIIYNYISKNINYSSVSFRQSDIIPQKASKTIRTHLGDCKDISTLFVALANLSGLKANLVLVDTRDNGRTDMVLPSFGFNHCIVKYFDEKGNENYLELTDRDLPFRSLPYSLYQALSLTIPSKDDRTSKSTLVPVNTSRKTLDKVRTNVQIEVADNALKIVSSSTKIGSLSSSLRGQYKSLSQDKVNKQMQESVSRLFTNPVKLSDVSFQGLDGLGDSITVAYNMQVNNEVKKIGKVSAFKVPYTDVIISADPFNLEKRNYDFEYWNYEYADEYETETEISLPAGKTFTDIPKDEKIVFKDINYSISYVKVAPNKLKVVRTTHIARNNIAPADYEQFKDFVSKVLSQEGSYIGFQ